MCSRWQPQLDVARTCGTLEVLRMTTSDDRARGVVTTTLIVRADGRVACRRLPHVDYESGRWCDSSRDTCRSLFPTLTSSAF